MKLINIGFGNMVSSSRLISVVTPDSAPLKRIIQEARDKSRLIDATLGRRTRAVLVMDSDHVVLSSILPETIMARLYNESGGGVGEKIIAAPVHFFQRFQPLGFIFYIPRFFPFPQDIFGHFHRFGGALLIRL
jgi:regulator of extracellular matrix RemA (YlzA/DUF370 family)